MFSECKNFIKELKIFIDLNIQLFEKFSIYLEKNKCVFTKMAEVKIGCFICGDKINSSALATHKLQCLKVTSLMKFV